MDILRIMLAAAFDKFNANSNPEDYNYHVLDNKIIWTLEGSADEIISLDVVDRPILLSNDAIYVAIKNSSKYEKLEAGGQRMATIEEVLRLASDEVAAGDDQ